VTETLVLRGYQEELIEKANQGKNCLILAPTGSGKTAVAIAIAQVRVHCHSDVLLACITFVR